MSNEQRGRSVGLATPLLLDLTIEEGGRLLPSLRADVLLPMGAPQLTLVRYLHRVIDTMGVTHEDCLHCLTSTRLVEVDTLWQTAGSSNSWLLSADLRQWIGELLTTREVAVWLGRGRQAQLTVAPDTSVVSNAGTCDGADMEATVAPETSLELAAIWERLRGPRTVAEVLRHAPAVVLIDPDGQHATAVVRWLAARLVAIQLEGATAQLVEPALAWPGPLLLPVLIELRPFAQTLLSAPRDETPLMKYLAHRIGAKPYTALEDFFHWRLAGDGVLLLLDSADTIVDAQRRDWVVQAVSHFQRCFPQIRMVLTSRNAAQCVELTAHLDVHFTTILAGDLAAAPH